MKTKVIKPYNTADENAFLSEQEIIRQTGYTQQKKQIEFYEARKVKCQINGRGQVIVLRSQAYSDLI